MDKKNIVEMIGNYISAIDEVVDSIDRDCKDCGGPMPASYFGQLKAYRNCRGMFEDLLSTIEEGDNE